LWGHAAALTGHESGLSNDELLSSIGESVLSIAESGLPFDKLAAWSGAGVEGFDESPSLARERILMAEENDCQMTLEDMELLRTKINELINAARR
jgi:hypothetical protein